MTPETLRALTEAKAAKRAPCRLPYEGPRTTVRGSPPQRYFVDIGKHGQEGPCATCVEISLPGNSHATAPRRHGVEISLLVGSCMLPSGCGTQRTPRRRRGGSRGHKELTCAVQRAHARHSAFACCLVRLALLLVCTSRHMVECWRSGLELTTGIFLRTLAESTTLAQLPNSLTRRRRSQ